ncbi:MAG: rod shape-determining protein MreC [Patescibacteria group bacterium]|jgi:rod shape-determining protein MreC
MQFLRQNIRLLLLSGLLIIILVSLYYLGALTPVQKLTRWLIQPIQNWSYQLINRAIPLQNTTEQNLLSENDFLKNKLTVLTEQNLQLQQTLQQYKEYENQLRFAQVQNYQFVPAKIISRVGQGQALALFTINQGKTMGVTIGDAVVYNDGVLIGLVYQVYDEAADVVPLTSNLTKLQAMTLTNNKTTGLVTGSYGTGLQMEFILKDQIIQSGDLVVTKADQQLPAGLIIGTVQTINDQASELFKTAMLVPMINYGANSIVSVITIKS